MPENDDAKTTKSDPDPAPADVSDAHTRLHEAERKLHDLAEHIRLVAASADRDVTELVAHLASEGL
jgi:hypothetical protein